MQFTYSIVYILYILLHLVNEENKRGPQPAGTIPVTLDISGMYTNVPWEEGMRAFEEAMNEREDQKVPTYFLVKLLKLVLSSNIFIFDSELSICPNPP